MYGVVERQVHLWPAFPENESRPHAKKPHVKPHEEWLGFPDLRLTAHSEIIHLHRADQRSWRRVVDVLIETEYGLPIQPRFLNPNNRASRRFLLLNRFGGREPPTRFESHGLP